MLYLIYGKDTFRSREKLKELLDFFRSKISNLGIFKIEMENFHESEFEELLRARTLFENKYIVVCENLLGGESASGFVLKKIMSRLANCAESENIFIFLEENLEGDFLEEFKKHSQKTQEFNLLSGAKLRKWFDDKKIPASAQERIIKNCGSDLWRASKEIEKYELSKGQTFVGRECLTFAKEYNPFAICDAFASKNKTRMWVLLQEALLSGIAAEEVFYKISWQLKNLLLIKKTVAFGVKNLEKETKLHPFVIKKTLAAARNFTEGELRNYSFDLVKLYHAVRSGKEEFQIGLEKFLLGI